MEKANLSLLASEWARITIERWQKKIRQKGIGASDKLFQSFMQNIIRNSDGDPRKIELAFLFYGRFVDMGVGKGVKIGSPIDDKSLRGRAEVFKNPRQPKKWYSNTMGAETKKLAQLLSREFGLKGINIVEENFKDLNYGKIII